MRLFQIMTQILSRKLSLKYPTQWLILLPVQQAYIQFLLKLEQTTRDCIRLHAISVQKSIRDQSWSVSLAPFKSFSNNTTPSGDGQWPLEEYGNLVTIIYIFILCRVFGNSFLLVKYSNMVSFLWFLNIPYVLAKRPE